MLLRLTHLWCSGSYRHTFLLITSFSFISLPGFFPPGNNTTLTYQPRPHNSNTLIYLLLKKCTRQVYFKMNCFRENNIVSLKTIKHCFWKKFTFKIFKSLVKLLVQMGDNLSSKLWREQLTIPILSSNKILNLFEWDQVSSQNPSHYGGSKPVEYYLPFKCNV